MNKIRKIKLDNLEITIRKNPIDIYVVTDENDSETVIGRGYTESEGLLDYLTKRDN